MNTSQRAILEMELFRDEGIRLKVYRDTNGFWTIGIGHLLGSQPRMTEITKREAYALLAVDIEDAEKLVREVFPSMNFCTCNFFDCEADRTRYRALVNMAFNRGGHMKTSTTITPAIKAALIDNNWRQVAEVIKASPWAQQVGARALRLARMLETGASDEDCV